ncbi:MAG: hypothetical protein HOE90_24970 [Bacteriovoracaceae bacterium]|nr:hypothetical protein [Bacteriovoracaceae bacterium]
MKKLTLLLLILSIFTATLVLAKVVTDPSIGKRCHEMEGRRKRKIEYKQKTYFLLQKNRTLRAKTPVYMLKLRRRLAQLHNDLNQRHHLITLQIQNLEEEIIRKGCPGIPITK